MKSLVKLKVFFSFLLLLFAISSYGQDSLKIRWKLSSERVDSFHFLLRFSALIPEGLHIYADRSSGDPAFFPDIQFPDTSVRRNKVILVLTDTVLISDPLLDNKKFFIAKDSIHLIQQIELSGETPSHLTGNLSYAIAGADYFNTEIYEFRAALEGGSRNKFQIRRTQIDIVNPVSTCGDEGTGGKSSWLIFLLGLLGGFIALLTPCVFPLIPLTVSFFTKKSASAGQGLKSAALYGGFIILIYILLSIPFHLLDSVNPEILNNISTNTWLNILFFIVFIVFAFSFFGYYEITLPATFATGADSKSDLTSYGGIFFMALTLAIVSFSCTGPILGSLLAGALTKEGGAWQLTAGMGGFGLGLALPFALFALFPNWLQSLPKSGGWLNTVKVVLGFLELAMAIKFFSNADLVEQWGLLKREVFMAFWVVIILLIVLYLLGIIRFPHDGERVKLNSSRKMFAGLFLLMALYLSQGISNTEYAKLPLISGFPPPVCYSIYREPVNCKHEIEPLRDYMEAIEKARELNKPLLIDFTGWACVNCRKMEEQVWTDPAVRKLLKENFVVVSLYVDERKRLPSGQQQFFKTSSGTQREIVTVGDQWATFQSENFHAVAQPQYAILGFNESVLTGTKGYTPDPKEFLEWLSCGLRVYRAKNK